MIASDAYFCENQARRLALRRATGAAAPNGIDYLEVVDGAAGLPRQQLLLVHLFRPLAAAQLNASNVRFDGGSVVPVAALWAYRASDLLAAPSGSPPPGVLATELGPLKALLGAGSPPSSQTDAVLVVRTDRSGDFAPYRLGLVRSPVNDAPPDGVDSQLRVVEFSFKTACPTDLDCASAACGRDDVVPITPELDYATKDYAGFRQLMLDRLAVTSPGLVADNAADLPVLLVELFAHAADKLSYFQDAVATEAYLGTARRRRSIRRHARLLDYTVSEGSNARTFVQFVVGPPGTSIPSGTRLLTSSVPGATRLDEAAMNSAVAAGAPVFETMHDLAASSALNELRFYTWGEDRCCLPARATRATLEDTGGALSAWFASPASEGTLLAFVERRGPDSGLLEDADPEHRHIVRVTRATPALDALFEEPGSPGQAQRVVEIEWSVEDALPFPLCIWRVVPAGQSQPVPVSVAVGNIALADHGLTVTDPAYTVDEGRAFRPVLARGPLAWQGQLRGESGTTVPFDPRASAAAALRWDRAEVRPAIRLVDSQGNVWNARRDLLESDPLAGDFVVEAEDDGRAELRFGDGKLGRLPVGVFHATYRVGNGVEGNIGADTISHFVAPATPASLVLAVNNPLPARGGTAAESIAQVRFNAPQAFGVQERAVTEADYARAAERHPEVQRAFAARRHTGSWTTVFIDIDRLGGRPVDAGFQRELGRFLEPFRLSGHDFVIREARFVPVQILLTICVSPGFLRTEVRSRLLEAFSTRTLSDGTRGFFHPDNFSFGQALHLSQVLAVAQEVLGVAFVDTAAAGLVFRRRDRPASDTPPADPDFQTIRVAPFEVIRADNDVNRPQNGSVGFALRGGS